MSRQNIDWSQPAIMDLVVNDLAGGVRPGDREGVRGGGRRGHHRRADAADRDTDPGAGDGGDLGGGRHVVHLDEGRGPHDHRLLARHAGA